MQFSEVKETGWHKKDDFTLKNDLSLRECDGLLSEVLIHTSDKRPSHSHCYWVNDCQVHICKYLGWYPSYYVESSVAKGGRYFFSV